MSVDEAVGTTVHRLMWVQRVTQVQLAERTGIDRSSLSKKMRGARPWSVAELVVVAGELRVSPAELLGEAVRLPGDPSQSAVWTTGSWHTPAAHDSLRLVA